MNPNTCKLSFRKLNTISLNEQTQRQTNRASLWLILCRCSSLGVHWIYDTIELAQNHTHYKAPSDP